MIFPFSGNGNGSQRRRQQTTPSGCPPMQGRSFGTRSGDTPAPCFIPKQRHATSAQPDDALTGPGPSRAAAGPGLFHIRDFQKAAAYPPDSLQESGIFRFYRGMHFFIICERKLLKPQYLWQTRDSNPSYNYHPWIIHHHAVVSFRPWAWPLAPCCRFLCQRPGSSPLAPRKITIPDPNNIGPMTTWAPAQARRHLHGRLQGSQAGQGACGLCRRG